MIELVLCILAIIAVWIFAIPLPWAVTITVFASIAIAKALIRLAATVSESSR